MPINPAFRKEWQLSGEHTGHHVWTPNAGQGEIHGNIVGVHTESCTGCMKCIDVCPTGVFETWVSVAGDVADPVHEADCIFCLLCEMVCVTGAISTLHDRGSEATLDSLLRGV